MKSRVYRDTFGSTVAIFVTAFGVLVVWTEFVQKNGKSPSDILLFGGLGVIVFLAGSLWLCHIGFSRTRLTDSGITIYGMFSQVLLHAPWADIERYERSSRAFRVTAYGKTVRLRTAPVDLQARMVERLPDHAWVQEPRTPDPNSKIAQPFEQNLVSIKDQSVLVGYPIWLIIIGLFIYRIWESFQRLHYRDAFLGFVICLLVLFAVFPFSFFLRALRGLGRSLRVDSSGFGIKEGVITHKINWDQLRFASILVNNEVFRWGGSRGSTYYRVTLVGGDQRLSFDVLVNSARALGQNISAHAPTSAKLYLGTSERAGLFSTNWN